MSMVRKDAQWIYDALGRAFNEEPGKSWESISKIQLRAIIPEAESRELEIAKLQLEVDYIEFEVADTEGIQFPIKVIEDGQELTVNSLEEMQAYQARVHAAGMKVRNSLGEPELNFSVRLSPEDYKALRQKL